MHVLIFYLIIIVCTCVCDSVTDHLLCIGLLDIKMNKTESLTSDVHGVVQERDAYGNYSGDANWIFPSRI